MSELIRNAWTGWLDYTENSKMVALFFLALVLYWFSRRGKTEKYHALFKYSTFIAILCVCPFAAAVLMWYQTRFYDYRWIWNLAPITLVISITITFLWTEIKERKGRVIILTLSILGILYCSGSMGNEVWNVREENRQLEQATEVLAVITENGQNSEITLWAPREVMSYARALYGEITLPYGRNMWDPALNAYSYDTYGEREQKMYEWMCSMEQTGKGRVTIMKRASKLGVTDILLPENIRERSLQRIEKFWEIKAERLGEYYWIHIGEN